MVAGLFDGVNPCQLGTFAVFLVFLVWSAKEGKTALIVSFRFILVNMAALLCFRLGIKNEIFSGTGYPSLAAGYYVVLAILCAGVGIAFLYDWFFLFQGRAGKGAVIAFLRRSSGGGIVTFSLGLVLSVLAAFMANYWPIDSSATITANEMFLPGKAVSVFGGLTAYGFFQQWPLFLLAFFYFFVLREGRLRRFVNNRLSLFAIIAAAFYAALGGGLAYLFLPRIS